MSSGNSDYTVSFFYITFCLCPSMPSLWAVDCELLLIWNYLSWPPSYVSVSGGIGLKAHYVAVRLSTANVSCLPWYGLDTGTEPWLFLHWYHCTSNLISLFLPLFLVSLIPVFLDSNPGLISEDLAWPNISGRLMVLFYTKPYNNMSLV